MSQQPQSPDNQMTKLRAESLPPSSLVISPDGKSWKSPDGKSNGQVIKYGERDIYVPQKAIEIAQDNIRQAHQAVDKEGKDQRVLVNNPAEANAKAANIIATRVEADLKKPRPQDAEIKQAEAGYTVARLAWIRELLVQKQISPKDLESAFATLHAPGGDAIVYHLARVQIQILGAQKTLDSCIAPDGRLDGTGVNAWRTLQTLEAYRTNMEKLFLVPQIERRAAEAKTQRETKEKRAGVLTYLKNFEFSPDNYHKILQSNVQGGVLTPNDETEALAILAKRYDNFSPQGLQAKFGQSALERDREFRRSSEDKTLPDGSKRGLFLLREFRIAHRIPNDAPLTKAEIAVIKTKISLDVQRARLNEYRKHDQAHQNEIATAQAKYEKDFGKKGDEEWENLKKARMWS